MAKGDYLTKPQFGKPADACEQVAHDWLENYVGQVGEPVMQSLGAIIRAAVNTERERCAKLVPTNWCDPLLTGKDAPKMPLTERGVEALLRGIQDRIRANAAQADAPAEEPK